MKLSTPVKAGAAGAAFLASVTVIADGIVITRPNEIKMIMTTGEPSGFAPEGLSFKFPLVQSVFTAKTSLTEYTVPPSNIALQNGTVVAENLQSSVFIRFNGTREEREETLAMIRRDMPDYESQIKSLAEGALRDVVRLTIIASENEDETQTVTSTSRSGAINFLDTQRVGDVVASNLQKSINSILPVIVNTIEKEDGTKETVAYPRLEVSEYRIGNFDFDSDYDTRRDRIANARANAEAARYEEAEAIRKGNAVAATAEGDKRAEISRAEGQAQGIALRKAAEAEGLRALVEAAGGAEALREQTLAEKWNGQTPNVVGGEGVIVDGRFAPGAKDVVPALPAPGR